MPSPTGIYLTLTQAERDALRVVALARMTGGDRTSLSALGKAGSKLWPLSPQDMLFELNYANNQAAGIQRPQKVVSDLTGVCGAFPSSFSIP